MYNFIDTGIPTFLKLFMMAFRIYSRRIPVILSISFVVNHFFHYTVKDFYHVALKLL